MEDKYIMVKCDCGGEAIEVQYWPEKDHQDSFYFSLWRDEYKRPLHFREKIRWCWNILRTGNPWADRIILNSNKAKMIAEFINQNIKDGK